MKYLGTIIYILYIKYIIYIYKCCNRTLLSEYQFDIVIISSSPRSRVYNYWVSVSVRSTKFDCNTYI